MYAYFYCVFFFLDSVFWRQTVPIPLQPPIIPGCTFTYPVFYGYIAFPYFIVINLFSNFYLPCPILVYHFNGSYAFYTRPMDGFIKTGSGGGIGFGLCNDIEYAVIEEEKIISKRIYHTLTECKNGAGTVPIKGKKCWIQDPSKVITEPSEVFLVLLGKEQVEDVLVVFTNEAIARTGGKVYIYYASCDTRMHVAVTTIDKLDDYLFQTPKNPLRSADCVRQRCDLIEQNKKLLQE